MSGIYITNHKIITTKHGQYITVITKDYDIYNVNIDKKIESYDRNFNFTKNIYRKIRNFKKKFKIYDDKKQLLAIYDNY